MLIDTHCHLFFEDFDGDRAMVIGNAKKVGVKQFIVPGVDEYSSYQAITLAGLHPGEIFAAVGFHPYEANKNPNVSSVESFITKKNSVVAIGECGLDYHLYKGEPAEGKKDAQKHLFADQLRLAIKYNLPVIMHCRDAFEDFFSVFDSLPISPRGVIHCFSGGLQELRMATQRELFIGVDGNITYSKQIQEIIRQATNANLLLETDSPYLTPIPHRGTRNEPKYLPLVAKTVATLQNKPIEEIMDATTTSAMALFGIPRWKNL